MKQNCGVCPRDEAAGVQTLELTNTLFVIRWQKICDSGPKNLKAPAISYTRKNSTAYALHKTGATLLSVKRCHLLR